MPSSNARVRSVGFLLPSLPFSLQGNTQRLPLPRRIQTQSDSKSDASKYSHKPIVVEGKSADFLLVLAKGAESNQVNLVSGDDSLKKLIPIVSGLKFDLKFPDDGPTRLRLSGILRCSTPAGTAQNVGVTIFVKPL